jgi:hypothetical protein
MRGETPRSVDSSDPPRVITESEDSSIPLTAEVGSEAFSTTLTVATRSETSQDQMNSVLEAIIQHPHIRPFTEMPSYA